MRYKELVEKWTRAGLSNDFIFNKTFLDPGLTSELLNRVLPDLRLTNVKIINTQYELVSTHDAKGLRFDIYAEDDHGNRFDIEMQVLDKHNLPQRIRFYQSTLALDSYERGEDYLQVRNAYVIFFCCFDPFGRSDQWYRIRRGIDSGQTFYPLSDGETTLCYDVTSLRKTVSPPLQNFLDLVAGRSVEDNDDFIVQLRKRIASVKQNRKWRREYMLRTLYEMDVEHDRRQAVKEGHARGLKQGMQEGIQEGIQQGIQQGATDERLQLVCDLINSGQTGDEVLGFLTTIRKWPAEEAHRYYQQALEKIKK